MTCHAENSLALAHPPKSYRASNPFGTAAGDLVTISKSLYTPPPPSRPFPSSPFVVEQSPWPLRVTKYPILIPPTSHLTPPLLILPAHLRMLLKNQFSSLVLASLLSFCP